MLAKITAEEYAAIVGRSRGAVYTKARNGLLKTASKKDGQWLIDENEPWPDGRTTSTAEKVIVSERVCQQCGCRFKGGPRARFCDSCKRERSKAADVRHKQRKRLGEVRRLGEVYQCERCGKDYTLRGANQKYCPTCAEEAVKEADRKQSLDYYHKVGRVRRMSKKRKREDGAL